MQSAYPVFVSSTFADLEEYRAAIREALHRLELVVRGMEYFGAQPDSPRDECLRIVRTCTAYVGVFAMRYGSIDQSTGKSFTHLEYDEAQRINLPSLVYMIDEERQAVLPKYVDTGEGADKLKAFKAELRKNHVVSQFTTPADLVAKLTVDLPAVAQRNGFEVRSGELAKLVASLPRVDWLTDERFAFLKKKIGPTPEGYPSDEILREALEFMLAGDNMAAFFLVARKTHLDAREALDFLMRIEDRLRALFPRSKQPPPSVIE
jgi:hypothetical protein